MSAVRFSNLSLLGRLLTLARPYWLHLGGILALALLAGPLTLLTPLPLKIVVDSVLGPHALSEPLGSWLPAAVTASSSRLLVFAALLLIIITLLMYLQGLGSWLLQTYTGEKLVLRLRARLFRHVQRLSLTYHDTIGSSDSVYRIQWDAPSIQNVLISGGVPLVAAAFLLVGMVVVTAVIDWQLAFIALLVCPALYGITESFGHRLRGRWREIRRLDSSAMSVVQEVLSAVRVVKAFGREDYEQERFVHQSQERVRGQICLARLQGWYDLLVGLTVAAGSATVLFVGVTHVQRGVLTLGELLVVMAYLAQIYEPLKTISKRLADLQSGFASAERAFAVLDREPEVRERPHARPLVRARGAVTFDQVAFAYEKGHSVLQDIHFHVEPGVRVGIQGRTGAGKTTLISLLMRFYDPDSGRILLDGVDLRDYRLPDLRGQFSLVLQDPVLFSTSIEENIAYGRPGASDAQIQRAAEQANAHEFVCSLPEGYRTQVGERGMKLSGGERQRISLARAFLRNAPLLILDEPTSSVDVKTEAAILDAMERLMRGRTTFMIAHRLSTLESCDLRLELSGGRLVEPASAGVPLA
jgi:ATP-binding cassette subfamily B protein